MSDSRDERDSSFEAVGLLRPGESDDQRERVYQSRRSRSWLSWLEAVPGLRRGAFLRRQDSPYRIPAMAGVIFAIIIAAIFLFSRSSGQGDSRPVNGSPSLRPVPTGTPIPGNYAGPLRPQVHFSPPTQFMNDPNGMFVDASGTWHLYYQYNPTALVAGNQHWGHATSRDLYHWMNQPIALFPPDNLTYVFSGSVVVDVNNTSGFFPSQNNGVVAIFTLAKYYEDTQPRRFRVGPQQQAIAYSHDDGYTFQYYTENPVIASTSSQFRDPKVVWYEDHWVMVVAYSQEFVIGFFTSPDLKTWTHASNFSNHGLYGAQWECPNLVKVPVRDEIGGTVTGATWVLTVSISPGAPQGGSATQYFHGSFDGKQYIPSDAVVRMTDFCKDNYAAQYFYGLPEGTDAVNIGWASNWQYAREVPTGQREDWRSAMTLPRRNYLTRAPRVGYIVASELYDPAPVLDTQLALKSWSGNGSLDVDYSGIYSNALYIDVNVTGLNLSPLGPSPSINLTFSSSVGESLSAGYNFGADFFIDRGNTPNFGSRFFTGQFSVADIRNRRTGTWRLQAVIDRSILEVFLDGGVHAGTATFFPTQPLNKLRLMTDDLPSAANFTVGIWALKSAWKEFEDAQGIVYGNVTKRGAGNDNQPMGKKWMEYEAAF